MVMVKHRLLLNAGWQRVRARGERDEGKRERRSGCVHVPWYSARPPSTSSLTLRDFFIKVIPSGKRKRHTLEEFILNAYLAGFGRASFPLLISPFFIYVLHTTGRPGGWTSPGGMQSLAVESGDTAHDPSHSWRAPPHPSRLEMAWQTQCSRR